MANSVDLDQIPYSLESDHGSTLFAQDCPSKYLRYIWWANLQADLGLLLMVYMP